MRIPYAAEQLREQVLAAKPRAKVEPHGEPDGLGVVRSLAVSKAAAKWLDRLLEPIDDPRIVGREFGSDGRLIVTFVPTITADLRDEFPLQRVADVLDGKESTAEG